MKPSAVAQGTSDIFSLYFNYGIPHFEVAKNFLIDYTLPFVDNMRAGFAQHPNRVDKIGIGDTEDYKRVMEVDKESTLPKDETLELFDFALVTMAIMPEVAFQRYKDVEENEQIVTFSRIGMLQPPYTLEQTRKRIRELWVETYKVAMQQTDPDVKFFENPGLIRTTLFWDVCRDVPMVNPQEMLKDEEMKKMIELAERFKDPQNR